MIEFNSVSLHFGGEDILREVRLRIAPGERIGVIGPNGAGKSTLFALITGEIAPYRGTITLPRDSRLGHVRQQLPGDAGCLGLLDFTLSGMTDVLALETRMHDLARELGVANVPPAERERRLREMGELETRFEILGGYALRHRAEAALCGLGFEAGRLTEPLAVFSGGWRMRAELARALIMRPDILLLDEPSNYLDVPAVEWLQKYLRDFGGTLLLISHDRYLLETLTAVTLEVHRGEATRYECGYAGYVEERRRRSAQQAAAVRNVDRKRRQIERFVERFRAKNTKASQVQSRIKALARMEDAPPPPPASAAVPIRLPEPPPCGHELLRLESAGLTYDGRRWIFRGVDLRVLRGDRIALVGYNGMGKTSLLRIMAGARAPSGGRRVLGHKVRIGYQSQEFAETLPPEATVFETAHQSNPNLPENELRTVLGSFGFGRESVWKTTAALSGGEKIRLAFARLFVNPPNLLLLDEPTTHLDMEGRLSLEQALCDYPGSICFVSHDIAFVRRLANAIVTVSDLGIARFGGNYDDYRERGPRAPDTPAPDKKAAGADAAINPRARRRERAETRRALLSQSRDLKQALTRAEHAIERLEKEQREILAGLSAAGADFDYAEANRRLNAIAAGIETLTREWEGAAEALDRLPQAREAAGARPHSGSSG